MRVGILTFHNTPNYGATLQCYALAKAVAAHGHDVEIVNYMPPHTLMQYGKALFLGRRRSVRNFARIGAFRRFLRDELKMSGPPIFRRTSLAALSRRYDLVLTGSDEVWKVDHMRRLDTSFYLDFCDKAITRTASYAASASTVTDLRLYADEVKPLLERLDAIAVRDPSTAAMVLDLTGRDPTEVVDPTLIWDFAAEDLPPMREKAYLALYAWLDAEKFKPVRAFADKHGLEIVSIGARNAGSDANLIGIGPREWLRLMRHASAVVTDFFHGVAFSLIFERPFYAYVDAAKRMKLQHILDIAGSPHVLHPTTANLAGLTLEQLDTDWAAVRAHLKPRRLLSRSYVAAQLEAASSPKPHSDEASASPARRAPA
jgi:hypothetical protein